MEPVNNVVVTEEMVRHLTEEKIGRYLVNRSRAADHYEQLIEAGALEAPSVWLVSEKLIAAGQLVPPVPAPIDPGAGFDIAHAAGRLGDALRERGDLVGVAFALCDLQIAVDRAFAIGGLAAIKAEMVGTRLEARVDDTAGVLKRMAELIMAATRGCEVGSQSAEKNPAPEAQAEAVQAEPGPA